MTISGVVLITCIYAGFVGINVVLDGRNIAILAPSWCLLKLFYVLCAPFIVSISLCFQYFPYFRCLDFYPNLWTVSVFVLTILMFFGCFVAWSFKFIFHLHWVFTNSFGFLVPCSLFFSLSFFFLIYFIFHKSTYKAIATWI